jgi:hypothetical protein
MKHVLITFGLVTSILLSSIPVASAKTSAELDRYLFPNLEVVERIQKYAIDGWHYLDPRSIIVDISPSTSYLLILSREESDFRNAAHVKFSSTNSTINARFDSVTPIQRYQFTIPVTIAKIYKLNGRADRKAARDQIKTS